MSQSLNIEAFGTADKRWLDMKSIYDFCIERGIEVPEEVENFFDGISTDNSDLGNVEINISGCLEELDVDNGFDINIKKLPKNVKTIRVFML